MKRLSQTWRQKAKSTEKTSKHAMVNNKYQDSSTPTTGLQEGTPRRSQRLANSKSLKNDVQDVLQDITVQCNKNSASNTVKGKDSSTEQCSLFNSSFGFDAQALLAVDKMEQEHMRGKKKPVPIPGLSPIIPNPSPRSSLPFTTTCSKANDMQSTPNETTRKNMVGRSGSLVETSRVVLSAATSSMVLHHNVKTPSVSGMVCVSSSKLADNEKVSLEMAFNSKPTNGGEMSIGEISEGGLSNDHQTSGTHDQEKPDIKTPKRPDIETSNIKTPMLNGGEISTNNSSSTQNSSQGCLTQEQCELSSWGLPDSILEQYLKIGITTMFEWQAQCLRTGNVLNGGNLVYSAPTSAGKTMVAEILMLKRILETKCKAMFILPFVSVAREKMFYLQRMFGEAGIKVDGYMGSQVPTKGFGSIDIAVCTIEKANGLVNRLMETGQLHSVGVIIVDEMHLIGDTSRGYLLELLLTKVLYMSQCTADTLLERNVQIIGMSATLPNLNVLATWLRADLYFTSYRPVPLTETFKVGPVIYDRSGNVLRELSQSRMVSGDDDHVLVLCRETVEEGNGVLVFCPTKAWCEKLAESIAKHFYASGSAKTGEPSLVMFDYDALKDVFEQLRSCQVGLDNVLGKTLRYGVAYHHAGLTYDERDIIEAGFRQGIIKVLVATSTLSSGVNLPARRVIIRTPMFYGKLLDALVYKQMSGRAGRKGVDSQGESIIICKTNEKQKARSLLEDDLKPVESCLVVKRSDEDEGNGIKRALLEIIASGVATTPADVQRYASCTFYVSSKEQEDGESTKNIIATTVGYLEKNEFITLKKKEDASTKANSSTTERYVPTQLGQATLASSLSPDEALVVFADLRKARKCFVLENELHILYQVTPIYVQDQWPNLDWYQYLRLWERLPSHMKRVSDLVGIEERFLNRAIRTRPPTRSEAQRHALRVHKRFYVALALHDLVHEVPLDTVARRYGASRGMFQSLQSSAATFAGMVTVFCHKLGWNNLEMLLSQFQNRLTFGIERELCDLVRISALNAFRARVLYSAGYHTIAAVAAASPAEVEKHLRSATPFQSNKKSEGESDYELRRRMRAKCVWVNGGKALTESEAAQEVVREACALLKEDALKLGVTWKPGATVASGEQDSKPITNNDVSRSQNIEYKNGDNHGQEKSSEDFLACKVTQSLETSKLRQKTSAKNLQIPPSNNVMKSSTKDPHIQDNRKEGLCSEMSSKKGDNVNDNMAVSTCNDQVSKDFIATTCSNTSTAPSSRPAVGNSTISSNVAVVSLPDQIAVNENANKTKDIVSETSQIPRSTTLSKEEPVQGSSVSHSASIQGSSVSHSTRTCSNIIYTAKENSSEATNCTNVSRSPKGFTLRKPLFETHGDTCKKVFSSVRELPNNKELTSDVGSKPLKGMGRETPRKKRDSSLKRKHSMSKSPKDGNGPKVKLMDPRKPSGYSDKQVNARESILDPPRSKSGVNDQKDNFYTDCLDNFKMKEHGTPSKRKARCVLLLESSTDSQKVSSGKVPTLSNNKKYSNPIEQSHQVLLPVTSEFSNKIKTPEKKITSSDPLGEKHFDVVDMNECITMEKNKPNSHSKFENPISEVTSNLGNPFSSNTKTPTGRQFEVQDESPELITTAETDKTTPALSKVPFTEIEYKTTSPDLLVTSPELYSEALFPDYQSPQDQSFEMQVDKMSESSGFENLDISLQNLAVSLKEEENKILVEDKEETKPGDEVHTPCGVNLQDKRPEENITSLAAICTPGMFDSEMLFSQLTQVPLDNNRSPEAVITHRNSAEQCRQNTEQPFSFDNLQKTPEQSKGYSEELPNSPGQSRTSPEQSQRSFDSFSLRLSQSFECASDSDLSSRALAAVAALEEKEMIAKDNQDKKGYPMDNHDKGEHPVDNQDSDGFEGFQEISNISLLTLAAIEAMDEELHQNHTSNLKQKKNEPKSVCESHASRESRVPHESSSASERRFTEIEQRSLPTKSVVSKSHRSAQTALSDVKECLKKSLTGSKFPFDIVDIAKNRNSFELFVESCKSNSFSFSVALEKRQPSGLTIGKKFNKGEKRLPARQKHRLAIEADNLTVVGVAACWGNERVFFLSLEDEGSGKSEVPWKERMDSLQSIMGSHADNHVKIAFGMKDQYKILSRACGVVVKGELQDPKIAAWLLDPGAKEKNFLQMVEHFFPQKSNLLQGMIGGCGYAGLGQATQSSVPARERSCLDAVFARMLMAHFRPMLEADGLWEAFTKIEMPVINCLARMELNGFGFSNSECEQIKHVLRAKLCALEQEAYGLANRSFSLTSPEEVSRVLFLELKLPPDGHTDVSPGKAVRPTRGGRRKKVKYFSTSKDVLEKLISLHPLPKVILEWRRINSALTKVVFPVQKEQVSCDPPLSMSRIFPTALTHTATGRVTFVEPNIQNVPRDFDINLPTVISDTPPNEDLERTKRHKGKGVYAPRDGFEPSSPGPQFSVSLRSAFVPFTNGILLAADYSQLELRLIAHLSSDGKLVGFLNAGGDAFRMIAGEIFHIAQDQISDEQRQRAKHVCYGIIYGIGAKALGQTLGVDENESALFVDAFKARFTGVRAYLKRTVHNCRRLGYVTTISGRRRYLPNIRSPNAAARSQAERQAVNTTVQGSAADLVKLAMANIDRRMCEQFTNCWQTHRQKSEDELGPRSPKFGKRREQKFRGANLVLQLHDELLFEVVQQDLSKVVGVVKDEMEAAMKLSVKIPVKIKSGKSWGTMVPIEF